MSDNEQKAVDQKRSIELVIFTVNDLICGLKSTDVQEIIKKQEITQVHNASEYVKGVINLRGNIVTVIDLHTRLNQTCKADSKLRIIIVNYDGESIGLLVDEVDDILNADQAKIEPPPANLHGLSGNDFSGIFKMDKKLVAIINIDELMNVAEV
jgi:purine-binding chemotaxis protein CheW